MFLVVALVHSPHSPCRVHTTLYCARYQRLLFTACICLSLHAPAWLIDLGEANLPPRHARAPARAINTHPSTPHPSNHQSPITHSLTHPPLSLSSSFTKQHTHTIRTYLRTTLHSYVHHCLSLALVRYPRLHAASINPSPDRLYSALSSRRRSETASIPACFACQHLTHPTLQPAIN